MRSLYILLAVTTLIAFASCGKKNSADPAPDPNANLVIVPDTGLYQVKTGTVTVTSPDSTYSYDASKDFVAVYNTATTYLIACNNLKNESLYIQAAVKPSISSPNALQLVQLTGVPLRLGYYYINSTLTNVGIITLTNYNTNAVAASGSFTSNLGRVINNTYYTFINSNNYIVSGTFNLKLNPKP